MALAVPGAHLLMVESKTRKSVFLQEAVRALELEAGVATARFEELLAKPDLHEAHDLVTIRAVRIEARVLMSIQAFARPGGLIFLFRGAAGEPAETVIPHSHGRRRIRWLRTSAAGLLCSKNAPPVGVFHVEHPSRFAVCSCST